MSNMLFLRSSDLRTVPLPSPARTNFMYGYAADHFGNVTLYLCFCYGEEQTSCILWLPPISKNILQCERLDFDLKILLSSENDKNTISQRIEPKSVLAGSSCG